MKKVMKAVLISTSLAVLTCCSTEDPFNDYADSSSVSNNSSNNSSNSSTPAASGTAAASVASSELATFQVAIDQSTAEPATTVAPYYPDEEDDFSANTFGTEVNITFNGNNATYTTADGVSITANGAHVVASHGETKGICYVVSGTTDSGSLTIVGDKKYEVRLNGADITNPDSTALNLLSKKRAYLVLADGTSNKLTDGTASKAEDQKGALYCKGKLLIGGGSGQLAVYGNYNNGIHSADYIVLGTGANVYVKSTANHGVKANDGVYINGGVLNVEVSAAGAKGINCESNIQVNGGRTTVITTGGGIYEDNEAKGAAAVKCDSTFTMNGGELNVMSTGAGGKGIRASWEAYINGGTIHAITTGGTYTSNRDTASPKGIKVGTKNVHGVLDIKGGTVLVRTSGSGGEGIESKGTLTISDNAIVQVMANDDAINSSSDMYLAGGSITAIGTNNDGIDSNGNMYISGGTIVAFGASGAETGIDIDEQHRLYITGGNVFGIGGRADASIGSTTQGIVSTTATVSANSTVTVSDGNTTLATFAMPPYSYNGGSVLISAAGMQSGNSYTVNWGSSSTTVTASNSVSSSMGGMGGGGMGGNKGGRW